jgi:hypothetical protein
VVGRLPDLREDKTLVVEGSDVKIEAVRDVLFPVDPLS